jgi:hypothetical protein
MVENIYNKSKLLFHCYTCNFLLKLQPKARVTHTTFACGKRNRSNLITLPAQEKWLLPHAMIKTCNDFFAWYEKYIHDLCTHEFKIS